MVSLALVTLSFVFVCQDGEAQSKFREYTLDSLRVFDQLQASCEKINRLLGQPNKIVKFSIYKDCRGYSDFQVEIHEQELWALEEPFEESIRRLNSFLDKYRNRDEGDLLSYYNIEGSLHLVERLVTCIKTVTRTRRFKKDNYFTVEGCGLFGEHLGELMCAVDRLRFIRDDGLWLLTSEEVRRKIEKIKKEKENLEEERARLLEKKSKSPKQ